MGKHLSIILFHFLCFNIVNGNTIYSDFYVPIQKENNITVLKLTKLKNNKVSYLAPGSNIKYWTLHESSPQQGILEGFTEEALIIDGKTIPLSQIDKIKEKDRKSTAIWRTLGILAGLTITGFALAFAITGFSPSSEVFDVRVGFISTAFAAAFLTGTILLFKKPKKLRSKYKAEIIEISADELAQ